MKIGILGHGSIGKRHGANLKTLGHKVLCYDTMGRKDVASEAQLLKACDAIIISTPSMYHKANIAACVLAGKHMFIEKPIAMTDQGIMEMLREADAGRLVHFMGNNLRFHPCVREAKSIIARGDIGPPVWAHFVCAQKCEKYAEDVVINWGAHEVDMAIYLLGPVSRVVSAVGDKDRIDFILDHGPCRASFHLDYVTPQEIRESWIVGRKDRVGLELPGRSLVLGSRPQTFGGTTYDDDYLDEMREFCAVVEGDPVAMSRGATGYEGLATLKVLLDVRKQAGLP